MINKDTPYITCHYCAQEAYLTSSTEVYQNDYGNIYLCRPCNAYVGVHKATNKPLGTVANAELREWRKKAHAAFDPLWQKKLAIRRKQRGDDYKKVYARGSGYKWLREQMGLKPSNCHIGMFDINECKQVIEICNNWRRKCEARKQSQLECTNREQPTENICGEL